MKRKRRRRIAGWTQGVDKIPFDQDGIVVDHWPEVCGRRTCVEVKHTPAESRAAFPDRCGHCVEHCRCFQLPGQRNRFYPRDVPCAIDKEEQ